MVCCLFFLADCGWSLFIVRYVLRAPTPLEEATFHIEAFVSSCCFEDTLDIQKLVFGKLQTSIERCVFFIPTWQ